MEQEPAETPVNIIRLREQWKAEGIYPEEGSEPAADGEGGNGSDAAFGIIALAGAPRRGQAKPVRRAAAEAAMESLREEIKELRETYTRELQELKESHLLELRNLKGQELDLASLVYELAEELRSRKQRRRWYFLWLK